IFKRGRHAVPFVVGTPDPSVPVPRCKRKPSRIRLTPGLTLALIEREPSRSRGTDACLARFASVCATVLQTPGSDDLQSSQHRLGTRSLTPVEAAARARRR